jgi:hypothetical protein
MGRDVYRILVGTPEGEMLLGRPRRRWKDKIQIDIEGVGLGYNNGVGTGDRRWRMEQWGFGFRYMRGVTCLVEELLAFPE